MLEFVVHSSTSISTCVLCLLATCKQIVLMIDAKIPLGHAVFAAYRVRVSEPRLSILCNPPSIITGNIGFMLRRDLKRRQKEVEVRNPWPTVLQVGEVIGLGISIGIGLVLQTCQNVKALLSHYLQKVLTVTS